MLNIRKEATGEKAAFLKLEGEMTIEYAESLREALLEGLHEFDHLMLDCEQATAIDFFALQMICSAHRSSLSAGKLLAWQTPLPPELQNTVQATGFARSHGCDLCPEGVHCMWI